MLVVIGLLLFVIVCELAAIYDRQNGGKGAVIPPRSEFLVSVFSVDKKCRYD